MRISASLASDLDKLLPQFSLIAASPLFFAFLAVPIDWLPPVSDAASLHGPLLAAQAAIAALSLAVVLFALERVSARPDADDRIFNEYVRRSRVWPIFVGSLGAVAATGLILIMSQLAGDGSADGETSPLRNLVLAAGAAFAASVVLPAILLGRTLRLALPSAWRDLRREVNERNVRNSVRAFIARQKRLQSGDLRDGEDPFFAQMIPDPGEGSADEAIKALLEDGRRAVDERRDSAFDRSLDSIVGLVEYAMDELRGHGWQWDEPGSEARWPPVAELHQNLHRLREAAIRRGDQHHAVGLVELGQRLTWLGMERGCGELFSLALQGWESNYDVAARVGNSEFRRLFRRWASESLNGIVLQGLGDWDPAFLADGVRHHARLLFLAMEYGHADDFDALSRDFATNWVSAKMLWSDSGQRRPDEASIRDMESMHRYIMMGLAGCSMMLADRGRIAETHPYVQPTRSMFGSVEQLMRDFVPARDSDWGLTFLWRNPEMAESGSAGFNWVGPGRYAIRFFLLRLLELATDRDQVLSLDLGRAAQPIRRMFEANAEQIEPYVHAEGGLSIPERRERVLGALLDAERRYEEARDAPS